MHTLGLKSLPYQIPGNAPMHDANAQLLLECSKKVCEYSNLEILVRNSPKLLFSTLIFLVNVGGVFVFVYFMMRVANLYNIKIGDNSERLCRWTH